jgi:hypothetical protein
MELLRKRATSDTQRLFFPDPKRNKNICNRTGSLKSANFLAKDAISRFFIIIFEQQ